MATSGVTQKKRDEVEREVPWRARFDKALKDRGISRRDASERANFNSEYVGKMLRGDINPTVDRILILCSVCEIPVETIFSTGFASEAARDVIDAASRLTEEEAKIAHKLLRSLK